MGEVWEVKESKKWVLLTNEMNSEPIVKLPGKKYRKSKLYSFKDGITLDMVLNLNVQQISPELKEKFLQNEIYLGGGITLKTISKMDMHCMNEDKFEMSVEGQISGLMLEIDFKVHLYFSLRMTSWDDIVVNFHQQSSYLTTNSLFISGVDALIRLATNNGLMEQIIDFANSFLKKNLIPTMKNMLLEKLNQIPSPESLQFIPTKISFTKNMLSAPLKIVTQIKGYLKENHCLIPDLSTIIFDNNLQLEKIHFPKQISVSQFNSKIKGKYMWNNKELSFEFKFKVSLDGQDVEVIQEQPIEYPPNSIFYVCYCDEGFKCSSYQNYQDADGFYDSIWRFHPTCLIQVDLNNRKVIKRMKYVEKHYLKKRYYVCFHTIEEGYQMREFDNKIQAVDYYNRLNWKISCLIMMKEDYFSSKAEMLENYSYGWFGWVKSIKDNFTPIIEEIK